MVILIARFTKHVDADPPGGGNFAACDARTGCWIYDKVECGFISQIPVGQCLECIECQGNTGNCDVPVFPDLLGGHPLVNNPDVTGGKQPACEAATPTTCNQDTGCTTPAACIGCPAGENSPTYQAESCNTNRICNTPSGFTSTNFIFDDYYYPVYGYVGATVAAAAFLPPALGVVSPLGLSAPGLTLGGGGVLPAVAFTVRHNFPFILFFPEIFFDVI